VLQQIPPWSWATEPEPAPAEPIGANDNRTNTSGNSKKGKKRALEEPVAGVWDDYVSGEEDLPKGPGGPKMDPRLKKISLPCYRKDNLKRKHKMVRCLGMKKDVRRLLHGRDKMHAY
jgi:hypothetical protein